MRFLSFDAHLISVAVKNILEYMDTVIVSQRNVNKSHRLVYTRTGRSRNTRSRQRKSVFAVFSTPTAFHTLLRTDRSVIRQ